MVKLTLEMMFGDVLKWHQSDFDHIWLFQICAAAILDFLFKFSLKFVYRQIVHKNYVCWCFGVKLKWFWRYMKMSNLISRHLGFFLKEVSLWFWVKISNLLKVWSIDPGKDVWLCFKVKLKWFWPYMSISNLRSRYLGFLLYLFLNCKLSLVNSLFLYKFCSHFPASDSLAGCGRYFIILFVYL